MSNTAENVSSNNVISINDSIENAIKRRIRLWNEFGILTFPTVSKDKMPKSRVTFNDPAIINSKNDLELFEHFKRKLDKDDNLGSILYRYDLNHKNSKTTTALPTTQTSSDYILYVIDVDVKPESPDSNKITNGIPDFEKLKEKYRLPDTLTIKTPNNGYHYYYYVPIKLYEDNMPGEHPVSLITPNRAVDAIDLKAGYKGYVIAPYSSLYNGQYLPINSSVPIALLPTAFLKYCRSESITNREREKREKRERERDSVDANTNTNATTDHASKGVLPDHNLSLIVLDKIENILAATEVATNWPAASEPGRDNSVFYLASEISKYNLTRETHAQICLNYSDKKTTPKLTTIEAMHPITSGYDRPNDPRYAPPTPQKFYIPSRLTKDSVIETHQMIDLLKSIEERYHSPLPKTEEEFVNTVFWTMSNNQRQFIVNYLTKSESGIMDQIKTMVMNHTAMEKAFESVQIPYISVEDAFKDKEWNENNPKKTPKNSLKPTNIFTALMRSDKIQHINQMVYEPGQPLIYDKSFNSWVGHDYYKMDDETFNSPENLIIQEKIKELIFHKYIYEILSNSSSIKYEYIMSWIARRLQDPSFKPTSALVFYGSQGTGKSFLTAEILSKLVGTKHYMSVANINALYANHNAIQRTVQIVALEEVIKGSAHKDVSLLKDYLTSDMTLVTPKYVDGETVKVRAGVIMTSNHEHCVPAESNDRRFSVFKVSNKKMQNSKFFLSIINLLKSSSGITNTPNNGYHVLYTMLQDPNLITMDTNKNLKTPELSKQISSTKDNDDLIYSFVMEYLENDWSLAYDRSKASFDHKTGLMVMDDPNNSTWSRIEIEKRKEHRRPKNEVDRLWTTYEVHQNFLSMFPKMNTYQENDYGQQNGFTRKLMSHELLLIKRTPKKKLHTVIDRENGVKTQKEVFLFPSLDTVRKRFKEMTKFVQADIVDELTPEELKLIEEDDDKEKEAEIKEEIEEIKEDGF